MPTPEEMAEQYVAAEAAHRIILTAPGAEPVVLGPYANPAIAKEKLEAIRRFVAAAIGAAGPIP